MLPLLRKFPSNHTKLVMKVLKLHSRQRLSQHINNLLISAHILEIYISLLYHILYVKILDFYVLRLIMEHWVLRHIYRTLVVT